MSSTKNKQDTKFISHFFSLNCARDILPFFVGCKAGAAKEITESFGVYNYAADNIKDLNDNFIIVCGDGKRPRTGSVFRFLTKAPKVLVVDPELDLDWFNNKLPNLFDVHVRGMELIKDKIENIKIDCQGRKTLLAMPHSHACMNNSVRALTNYKSLSIVNLPCCKAIPPNFHNKQHKKQQEKNIWSAKNTLYFWNSVK